jgi:hypothetical protein
MRVRIRNLESCQPWIRDGKSRVRDKHPGSATLDKSKMMIKKVHRGTGS